MVRFGPSGNDELFYAQGYKATVQAPAWIAPMGLTAFEISFGRGTKMTVETARAIGAAAKAHNIQLSIHAPYYINLANDSFDNNYRWLAQSLVLAREMGAPRVIFHAASQGQLDRTEALERTKDNLYKVLKRLDAEGISDFQLCPEVMGLYREIGNVEEVCELCKIDPRLVPCVDFGHINCLLQGELKTNSDKIAEMLDYIESQVGREKLDRLHIHWSAQEFGPKGEIRHTRLNDDKWAFPFDPLAREIRRRGLKNVVIICESASIMAQDAVKLLGIYNAT